MIKRDRGSGKKEPLTFGEYVGPVRPLEPGSRRVPPSSGARAPRRPSPGDEPVFLIRTDGEWVEGEREGFSHVLPQVRQGRLAMFDTIDLHGLTVAEARSALGAFFQRGRGRTRRCVLVVHGKGAHSPGGRGVLRDEMATLLSSPPLSDHVLCFASASPKDGGSGALYVVLQARR